MDKTKEPSIENRIRIQALNLQGHLVVLDYEYKTRYYMLTIWDYYFFTVAGSLLFSYYLLSSYYYLYVRTYKNNRWCMCSNLYPNCSTHRHRTLSLLCRHPSRLVRANNRTFTAPQGYVSNKRIVAFKPYVCKKDILWLIISGLFCYIRYLWKLCQQNIYW